MSGLGQLCVVLETACRARGKRGVLLLWELWVQKWPPRKLGLRCTLPQAFASSWPHASPAFTSGVAVFPPSEGNLIWPSADCCLGGDAVSLLTATTATIVITVAAIDYVLRNFHLIPPSRQSFAVNSLLTTSQMGKLRLKKGTSQGHTVVHKHRGWSPCSKARAVAQVRDALTTEIINEVACLVF